MEHDNVEEQSISRFRLTVSRFKNNTAGMIGFYIVILFLLLGFFYPLFLTNYPFSYAPGQDRRYGGGANTKPNLKYPFGVNFLGFDNYSRHLIGIETAIIIGVVATMISLFFGVTIGLLAGYYEGNIEALMMRITDFFMGLPILMMIMILLELGSPVLNREVQLSLKQFSHVQIIIIAIGFFGWAGLARLVAANVKQVNSLQYIDAVRIMGASDARIIVVHVFPNILAPIIVVVTILLATAIVTEASLAYLGFHDPFKTVSWGIALRYGQENMNSNPEQALIPGFTIFFLVLAINIVGDGIRDALDPRLKD